MKAIQVKYVKISTGDLARLIGISGRRVNQLVDEGVIPKAARNQFDDAECIQAFMAHREAEIRSEYEKKQVGVFVDEEEIARKRHYDANISKIKYELMQGTSHDAEAISFHMGQAVAASRAKLLSIPNACAAAVADISDPEACRAILDEACREAALALSDYDPAIVSGKTRSLICNEENLEEENEREVKAGAGK